MLIHGYITVKLHKEIYQPNPCQQKHTVEFNTDQSFSTVQYSYIEMAKEKLTSTELINCHHFITAAL